jgi:hypothetical protein
MDTASGFFSEKGFYIYIYIYIGIIFAFVSEAASFPFIPVNNFLCYKIYNIYSRILVRLKVISEVVFEGLIVYSFII